MAVLGGSGVVPRSARSECAGAPTVIEVERVTDRGTPFEHVPVLLDQVLEHLVAARPALLLDCTVGGAGHARALLSRVPEVRLIALDRDPMALQAAAALLAPFGDRVVLRRAQFSQARRVLDELGIDGVDALLADLGVSSPQLDRPERGFSFRADGPLDMRMSPDRGRSAAELLSEVGVDELTRIIRDYGEERHARRVARAIVAAQPQTTGALAHVVRGVVPKAKDGIDPATRTFQALRIWVNGELDELHALLDALPRLLAPNGRAAMISFHSLEDRAVKQAFRAHASGCVCPPTLPVCRCGRVPAMAVVTRKPCLASPAENVSNPRARTAKLRVARRLPEGGETDLGANGGNGSAMATDDWR